MILVTAAEAPLEAEWSGHSVRRRVSSHQKEHQKNQEHILAHPVCNADVLHTETLSCTGTLG